MSQHVTIYRIITDPEKEKYRLSIQPGQWHILRTTIKNRLEAVVKDEKLAINIEKSLFNNAIDIIEATYATFDNPKFMDEYKLNYISKIWNLKHNDVLLENLISGNINPQYFVKMTHREMNPTLWKERDRLAKIALKDFDKEVISDDGLFRCGKCKQNKTTYYQMQTRSADEPMTTFITCHNCCNRWKQ